MNSHLQPDHDREHCWCRPTIITKGQSSVEVAVAIGVVPVIDVSLPLCGEEIEEALGHGGRDGTA